MAELAAAIPTPSAPPPARFHYLARIAAGAALVTLADWLFFFAKEAGATLAAFALAVLAALFLSIKPLRRAGAALASAGAASLFVLALAEDPSWLALGLFWLFAS